VRRALRGGAKGATHLGDISKKHPPLGRHLHKFLKTGLFCRYEPDPSVDWITT
jgi:hypothetical protein